MRCSNLLTAFSGILLLVCNFSFGQCVDIYANNQSIATAAQVQAAFNYASNQAAAFQTETSVPILYAYTTMQHQITLLSDSNTYYSVYSVTVIKPQVVCCNSCMPTQWCYPDLNSYVIIPVSSGSVGEIGYYLPPNTYASLGLYMEYMTFQPTGAFLRKVSGLCTSGVYQSVNGDSIYCDHIIVVGNESAPRILTTDPIIYHPKINEIIHPPQTDQSIGTQTYYSNYDFILTTLIKKVADTIYYNIACSQNTSCQTSEVSNYIAKINLVTQSCTKILKSQLTSIICNNQKNNNITLHNQNTNYYNIRGQRINTKLSNIHSWNMINNKIKLY